MNIVFPKNKEKRSRTSSGDSNNSFVKNVTSRVSGLIPATITKWFSSPKSSANGSAPAADATDSSTEDEAPESPASQPPAKRMRYSPSAVYGNTDANCVTNNIETIEPSTSFTVQSPPGRTTFRRETNYVSTPIRSPDDTIDRTDKDSNATYQQHTVTTIGPTISKKRKSLFGNQSQELSDASKKAYVKTSNNTVRDPKQPSFKPTLLGSPFYAGRTTYGGAASSYINQPNITRRQSTTVRESPTTSDNNISHSARRVMELLESYSSPLTEAKRIPHYTRPTRQELMKRISESSLSSSIDKLNSFKTQELHVPSIASILRLKQRSRLNDTTNAARQLIASHSSTSLDYPPYPSASKSDQKDMDGSNKLTTKVKSRLTRPNRGETNALDTETLPPVDLPKAVLQIDPSNLPKFGSPLAAKPSLSQKPSLTATYSSSMFEKKSTPAVETISKETVPSSSIYNFANPVRITSESPKTTTTPPKFTFGSPERKIDDELTSENKSSEPLKPAAAAKDNKAETATADWKCPDCWVSNKQDAEKCVCCGYKHVAKPSSKPKSKCTLCKLADTQANSEKCVNCDKVQVNNISKPLKADTSKWKCEDCWVSNDEAADKCVCCGGKNPKGASQVVPVKPAEPATGMCPKCFAVTTNGKCGKCAQVSSTPDKNFKTVLKSQSNKWECEHCLVRNDNDKTRCVCCEADRSGKPREPEKKQFNFGTVNTTFKFGIDPKVQEANLAKAVEKPVETKDKIEESETNNNVLAKAPTFSFGIPAKKSEDQPDAPKEKTEEAPKASFTFGLPKQNSEAPSPAPVFGIPSKLNDTSKDKEKVEAVTKPQEVKPVEEAPKPPVVMFGAPSTAAAASAAPTQPILTTSFTLQKKETPSNPLAISTTSISAPAPTLSFTASKPTTGLFGAIATTAPPASVNFAPITTPVTTATMFQKTDNAPKPLSMFQKSDPATTATVSLFQKSEAPVTATALPPAATAPMFSFGTAQSAQPQADKPKFNFTFGGNKTDNVFKPPSFGGGDPNNAMNKFILANATDNPMGASNPLASGNSLTGNSLASNSLTGNTMTSNSIASNPMSGNGMQAAAPAATSMFGSVQKENMWSPPNSSAPNPFVANASTNNAPKPFAFGSSTPFNAAAAPAFGAGNTQASTTPAFGAAKMTFGGASQAPAFGAASPPAPAPAFGTNVQSTPNIFGMNNQNNQPSMFSTPTQNSTGIFGSPQQPAAGSMPPPSMGMFGRPSAGAAPTFGSPSSMPTFEAPSLTPAQAPAFNFGSAPPSNMFGFGQQQQQQPQQAGVNLGGGQSAVYSFGGAPGAQAPVQFSMGSAPNAAGRRVRKAVRRSTQR